MVKIYKNKKVRRVYLDHAATTPLDKRVRFAVEKYWKNEFGNAGSVSEEGMRAKKVLDEARRKVAGVLSCRAEEIIFTSGGTESNNMAILGLAEWLESQKIPLSSVHMITTKIEHSSVLEVFKRLERKGVQVSYVGVGIGGIVNPKDIEKELRPNTVLVSVMYANNEIGTIQPISKIAKIIRDFGNRQIFNFQFSIFNAVQKRPPFLHCDASQAPLYLKLNVESLGVDLLTIDGHKIYGPKGVGALFVKRNTPILPIIFGGGQEKGLRPGTENIPLIVGLAEVLVFADKEREKESIRLLKLRDYLISELFEKIPDAVLNGDLENRLPNNVNISIKGLDAEFAVIELDEKGIACSTKSACLGHEGGGSYVIKEISGSDEQAKSSLRFTLGRSTTKKDIDYTIKTLVEIVNLQNLSKVKLSKLKFNF